ncbi:MAG TPA: ATP-binding protein, partial [Aggregatilineales bacterium]|nr:ATP-binding protein [Aggregatilineales bacterium]
ECVLGIVVVNVLLSLDSGTNIDAAAVFAALTLQWLCAAYAAARIRMPEQSISRALLSDILSAIFLPGVMVAIVYAIFSVTQIDSKLESIPGFQLYFLLNISTACLYLTFRLTLRLWRIWSVVRRRRLRWAITHTHVITVLAVMIVVLLYMTFRSINSDIVAVESPVNVVLLNIVSFVVIAVIQFIVAIPIMALVMALAVVISYRASKPLTARIENLAEATNRLRNGDYTARLEPSGQDEDEIALLESNFNAMAEELEKALIALQQERDTVTGLLQNQRELTASVSHELRTPIAVIRGNLEALQSGVEDSPPAEIQTIEREVLRLQTLIEDLFTLSRADVGQLTLRCVATDITPVIEHVVKASARQARERAEVKIMAKVPENLPPVLIDAGRLEQILSNLVQNAVRHTLPGGLVVISAADEHENGQMLISVHDTGQGIPPDDLPHIWNRFYRGTIGNSATPGTGLGLAVVKQLTEAMDGTVSVESTVGQGSRFDLRFPLA